MNFDAKKNTFFFVEITEIVVTQNGVGLNTYNFVKKINLYHKLKNMLQFKILVLIHEMNRLLNHAFPKKHLFTHWICAQMPYNIP